MEIQQYFERLIEEAIAVQASDIYVLPTDETHYAADFKTAGGLIKRAPIVNSLAKQLILYAKFKGDMDIAETRRPQVGQIKFDTKQSVYLRLSTVGDYQQRESLVCRLIYDNRHARPRFVLPEQFDQLLQETKLSGLIVFAGPMGSGKTSTIYALARQLADQQKLVLAIEDPIEIHEPNFLQLQVNGQAEMPYADLIKVGLRHRPDVFIIGEIRDQVTAKAAINAALSGHLVLTTIHARSAYGVLARLLDLGIEEHFLRATLNTIVYQRLLSLKDGEQGALQHQVSGQQIWETDVDVNRKWGELVEKALETGQISTATQAQYEKIIS
ncbi:hypothetical protein EQG49_02555 [Periweissella cryptocerci]|uniref:Bacterial type II secretion system protein E domain-containing protein n=1 Tax=Periweissella cryptocerci TaxID=2506420 RepID=A0A4P6YRY5_9LACO|nr:competence type IV pilus ATPase ComGA [Periweissella cryptocerci]QBO35424.1 hypothetical protein EQG49_02555 [Periweissella cryptocerci]